MPIYEYECSACKQKFEVRQGYDDKTLVLCPECQTPAKRLISMSNFSVGWRLSDASQERFGPKDEYEKDV